MIIVFEEMQFSDTKGDYLPTDEEIDYDLVEEFSQAFSSCNECEDKLNSV